MLFAAAAAADENKADDAIKEPRVTAAAAAADCCELWLLLLAARLGVDLRGERSWLIREEAACATAPPKKPEPRGEGASVTAVEGREFRAYETPWFMMPRPFMDEDSGLAADDDVVVVVAVGAALLMEAARRRDSSSS